MYQKYHRLVTQTALQAHFGSVALQALILANVRRDDLASLISHPEYHFVDNRMGDSLACIETQRAAAISALKNGDDIHLAWLAFGQLLHTAQDFYAHSNYVRLWAEGYHGSIPPADQIDALDPRILAHPGLHTVRPYRPLGSLANIPIFGRLFYRFLPDDAHARMSLDSEASGPLFKYAFQAAILRTLLEYQLTRQAMIDQGLSDKLNLFCGR